MALRNPFERLSFGGFPKPKAFQTPNMGQGDNNIFLGGRDFYGSSAVNAEQAAPPDPPKNEWGDYLSELRDIYTKQGPAAKAYQEHMGALPEYQAPSGWGKFGSALVGAAEGLRSGGAAGWQAGQTAAQAPYRRALEEWGMKEQALGRQAEIEDEASNRRLQFMKESRQVARDEQELGKWMRDYDHKVWQEKNDEMHREYERGRWDRQDRESFVDENGNVVEYLPGDPESNRVVGGSSKKRDWMYEGGRLRESQRGNDLTGQRVGLERERVGLAREAEKRLQRNQERYENPVIDAREQSAARAAAGSRAVLEDPAWEKFVDPETGTIVRPRRADSMQFQRFMERVQQLEDGILGRRRNLQGVGGGGAGERVYEY